MDDKFSQTELDGVYKAIFNRRDVRGEFLPDPVPFDVLARLLIASHHAPSVGLSQPWNFLAIFDDAVKATIHNIFLEANTEAALMFPEQKRPHYRALKLEGIQSSPVNLCVTCDRRRGGDVVLGKTHQTNTDRYSVACAVQNLWLAARAEGLGVGWVSIASPEHVARALNLPEHVEPLAYLCLGYVEYFFDEPELQKREWASRTALNELVFVDQWGRQQGDSAERLRAELQRLASFPVDYQVGYDSQRDGNRKNTLNDK